MTSTSALREDPRQARATNILPRSESVDFLDWLNLQGRLKEDEPDEWLPYKSNELSSDGLDDYIEINDAILSEFV